MLNKCTICHTLILICLITVATGCFWKKGEDIKPPEVSNPEQVSETCAKNAGLDEKDTAALTSAIKHYDGKFSDEFKLSAMSIISTSHAVDPKQKDTVTREYISCVGNSAHKK